MASWAWHCFDLVTGAAKNTVAMASWQHTDQLNDSGAFAAELAPPVDADDARDILGATQAGKAVIVAMRTDDAGNVRPEFTAWVPPGGNARSKLAGGNLLSYFDRRVLKTAVKYTATDQATILAELVKNTPGALVDFTSAVALTGRQRAQEWTLSDGKLVGEAMREIAARINGLDFDVRTELDAGFLVRRLRTWYPRRGGITTPTFTYGANMLSEPVFGGNPEFATEVYALGVQTDPGPPPVRLFTSTQNTEQIGFGQPIIDVRVDRTDITTPGALVDVAQGALHDAAFQSDPELTFLVDPNDDTWPWGSWGLGDDCRLEIPAGVLPWWPDGADDPRRITKVQWVVDQGGDNEQLAVTTGRPWTP